MFPKIVDILPSLPSLMVGRNLSIYMYAGWRAYYVKLACCARGS